MITVDGNKIKIQGNEIIDNADIFNRTPLPNYLQWTIDLVRWGFGLFTIDPYYTRFNSDFQLSIDDSTYEGFGVLEIMDLK